MIKLGKLILPLVVASLPSACAVQAVKQIDTPEQAPPTVAWNPNQPILPDPNVGYLRVETDSDLRVGGGQGRLYEKVRRPYEVYSSDGRHLATVRNGDVNGEQPRMVPLPPGRYVIASLYGKTYRRLQIEVHAGALVDVSEDLLRSAPQVAGS